MSTSMKVLAFGLLLMTLWAGTGVADIDRPPVSFKSKTPPSILRAGETHHIVMEMTVRYPATVTDLQFAGRSWTVSTISRTLIETKDPLEIYRLEFDLSTTDTDQPLEFSYNLDGQRIVKSMDLSEEKQRGLKDLEFLKTMPYADFPDFTREESVGPELRPLPIDLRILENPTEIGTAPDEDALVKATVARTITVKGTFAMKHDGDDYPVYGATVYIMADTWGPDTLMGGGTTDLDGNFDIDAIWWYDPFLPDIYVAFVPGHSGVSVIQDDFYIWDPNGYMWRSRAYSQVDENLLITDVLYSDGPNTPALNVLDALSRAGRWMFRYGGYASIPGVTVLWPAEQAGSSYNAEDREVKITYEASWDEGTIIHEYGHHWVHSFASQVSPAEYCNDFCDAGGCPHYLWCRENANVAFSEGTPNWIADSVCRDWSERYGFEPISSYNFESIKKCTKCNVDEFQYPFIVEGFFAALLRDIEDSPNEVDLYSPEYMDRMNLDPGDILDVISANRPLSPHQFIEAFHLEFYDQAEDFWETCMNNGFDGMDAILPTTNALYSNSHDVYQLTTNNYVDLNWSRAFDNFSGVGGYSFHTNTGSVAVMPDMIIDIDRFKTSFTVANLAPGYHMFSIRAVDRAGNWDDEYRSFGPVHIREPEPADLVAEGRNAGWDFPLVPKSTTSATASNVVADASDLYGNFYWNGAWVNTGDIESPNVGGRILLDGEMLDNFLISPLTLDMRGYWTNEGPVHAEGGRHVLEMIVDANAELAEPNEVDNRYGHQWIWKAEYLNPGMVHTLDEPPQLDGGFASVTDQLRWHNCDGLQVYTLAGGVPSPWAVVAAYSVDSDDEVDLQIHDAPTGSQEGYDFWTYQGFSGRPAGFLDAVLINAANRPAMAYTVGVYNAQPVGFINDYKVQIEYGEALESGVPFYGALEADESIALFTFDVTTSEPMQIYLQLNDETYATTVYAAWFDEDFVGGGLLDFALADTTDYNGTVRLDFTPTVGTHGLMLWRDRNDADYDREPFGLTVGPAPTDLVHFQPVGWDAPLIVAPGAVVTPTEGPIFDVLWGETASTYINMATENISDIPADAFEMGAFVDGSRVQETAVPSLAPGENVLIIPSVPVTVHGGRHLVHMKADLLQDLNEADRKNNKWASQHIWRPSGVGTGASYLREAPPYPTGGWENVRTEQILYYNCDGIETPTFLPVGTSSQWGAVVTMPGPESDVDLRLFAPHVGGVGFDLPLIESTWVTGNSDFILMNFHNTPLREFEAGIIQGGTKIQEDYRVGAAKSTYGGTDPIGTIGTFSIASNELLKLVEVNLATAGYYTATLDIAEPTLDLGLSLYGPGQEFYTKDQVFDPGSAAWLEPAGASESFNFRVDTHETGYFCLAVWKVGSLDGPIAGSYTLSIDFVPNLPDVAVTTPTGWDAPLVPRPAQDATYSWASIPASIPGDTATTYFNFAHISYGYTNPGYFEMDVMLDDWYAGSEVFTGGYVGYSYPILDSNPGVVTGGRHTVAFLVDPYGDLDELDETNNTYGTQYVWTPKTLAMNTPNYRVDPAPYFAGWEHITTGIAPWYNCDAVRTPYFYPVATEAFYACVAIMPEDLSNPNLGLYTMSTGLTDGFTTPLETSNFPAGHSDFILINFNANHERQFDAGITITENHNEELKVVVTESSYMGSNPTASVGDYLMSSDDLVNLFEFRFDALGFYRIELNPLDANCDLGISLYGPDAQYYSKVDVVDDGVHGEAVSFFSPPGEQESFDFIIDTPGYYVMAVWKVGAVDRASSSSYNLTFTYGGAIGVEEDEPLPRVTRLAGVYPNPFNPMTTVAFELSSPQNVHIEIFDLRGRLVRTLANESMPAGHHERIWRGSDNSGKNVSSGIYMIRMTAGKTVELKRVSLLK